jgi:hypothetical protein
MVHARTSAGSVIGRSRSPLPWVAAAALLFCAALAMRFPGVAMYDSVTQYQQAVSGSYDDWHPPIMAHAWALLNHVHGGTAPLFLIQMLLWWSGLGLLAAALGQQRRHGAAALVLLVGIAPLWLGWTTVVLKDAEMACCLVAAAGLAGYWRFDRRNLPSWAVAMIAILLTYATLVRGNAVFATIPFALALAGWPRRDRLWVQVLAGVVLTLAVLAISPFINHRLLRAAPSGVERVLPLYDMVGIAHYARLPSIAAVPPALWAESEQKGCYTPYYWNPYGEDRQCGGIGTAAVFEDGAVPHLMRDWMGQVLRHPIAYARHRLSHLNSNLRFWVRGSEPDATPPIDSEPNKDGLGARPNAGARLLVSAATIMLATPLGWPVFWLAIAGALTWASAGRTEPQARLGRALAISALCMSGSFAVVSIASDLRYHLWSMVAAALALILLIDARALDRRRALISGGLVLAVVAIGIVARLGAAAPVYIPVMPPATASTA